MEDVMRKAFWGFVSVMAVGFVLLVTFAVAKADDIRKVIIAQGWRCDELRGVKPNVFGGALVTCKVMLDEKDYVVTIHKNRFHIRPAR